MIYQCMEPYYTFVDTSLSRWTGDYYKSNASKLIMDEIQERVRFILFISLLKLLLLCNTQHCPTRMANTQVSSLLNCNSTFKHCNHDGIIEFKNLANPRQNGSFFALKYPYVRLPWMTTIIG